MAIAIKKRLIVALNVDALAQIEPVVNSIGDAVSMYKVGHQLFTAEGPDVLSFLLQKSKDVFLDLQLHEIPDSVTATIKAVGYHGVNMVTIHASGGRNMMEAAVSATDEFPDMKILALTVITGLVDRDLARIRCSGWPNLPNEVAALASFRHRWKFRY